MKYLYTGWIRDSKRPADDEDYEWPLSLLVEGTDQHLCKEWGDYLTRKDIIGPDEILYTSEVEDAEKMTITGLETLRSVVQGLEPPPGIL